LEKVRLGDQIMALDNAGAQQRAAAGAPFTAIEKAAFGKIA